MKIELDLKFIQNDLALNEYVLLHIVHSRKGTEYVKHLGNIDYESLQARGYIKFNPDNFGIILRDKALKLFRLDAIIFDEFFRLYPSKTPKGRALRTEAVGTRFYTDTAKLWARVFKNKPDEAKKAVQALRDELAYRTANDELEYLVGIKKWIDDGHFDNTYEMKNVAPTSVNFGFSDL